ncbi:hypothetical protein ACE4RU_07340 [Actinobacillus seminis]|uniref:hypothetical protein n=1 Tax=Actinobacillus seminis TaxID=722 RepID=UPI003B92C54C
MSKTPLAVENEHAIREMVIWFLSLQGFKYHLPKGRGLTANFGKTRFRTVQSAAVNQ